MSHLNLVLYLKKLVLEARQKHFQKCMFPYSRLHAKDSCKKFFWEHESFLENVLDESFVVMQVPPLRQTKAILAMSQHETDKLMIDL